jgi:segregation and condensation protein B
MGESENLNKIKSELIASVEALLFVSAEPVSPTHLATIIEISPVEVQELLESLQENYRGRGIRLQWHAGKVQLTSAPEKAELIESFLGLETSSKLSRAALETLAIIAYRQPVTRPNLEGVRGVNSDGVLRSLLNKGLIQEVGRSESPGRPILYGTTPDFLQYFGLNSLTSLPPLENTDFKSDKALLKE